MDYYKCNICNVSEKRTPITDGYCSHCHELATETQKFQQAISKRVTELRNKLIKSEEDKNNLISNKRNFPTEPLNCHYCNKQADPNENPVHQLYFNFCSNNCANSFRHQHPKAILDEIKELFDYLCVRATNRDDPGKADAYAFTAISLLKILNKYQHGKDEEDGN